MSAKSDAARPSSVWPTRARKTNARAPMGPFIGREEALARIDRAFEEGSRLVTVLGPPGIGKTRLSQRWLELHGVEFEHQGGAWFCDLTEVTDAAGLEHAVASVLPRINAAQIEDAELAEAIASAGAMLLVLDNFEQVTFAGDVVRVWCEAAPELRVIVTSRERLAVRGETVLELDPLACPREDDADAEVLACEAVRLLAARAAAIGGELGGDARALGALVRQLDGIPLAIELAAARTRLLSPNELAARLGQSLDVLSRGRGPLMQSRHATLTSAIDWSWNLLSPAEQRTLAECSVFAGSFTIEAAEAVLTHADGESDVVDRISALRDKSLVHAAPDGRLALYVSIRAFAARKLGESGAAEELHFRHARHHADLARRFNESRTLQGAEPDGELRIGLTRDRHNLLAAQAFVRALPPEKRSGVLLAELALGLTNLQGAPAELALDAFGDALADANVDVALRARVLLARQTLFNAVGRFDESLADLRTLLALEGLAPGLRVLGLVMQGIQLRYQGHVRASWESHSAAVGALEAHGSPRLRAMNMACMGRLCHELGDADGSREHNGRAREMCVAMGDPWLGGLPLANLAQLAQEEQRFTDAAQLLDDALARFRLAGEPQYIAIYAGAYGELLFEQDRPDEARRWYTSAARFFTGWLAHRHTALLHAGWGALEARHGSLADADMHLARARRASERCPSPVVRLAVELHEAHMLLRRASDDADRETARWRARVEALRGPSRGPDDERELVATSFDVRFALRMLARALGPGASPALSVAESGDWFALGRGERVDLGRRGSLKRILGAMVERHRNAPGSPLSRDALLAVGWPDERLHPEAASKRLRVAIATLRSLGLRDVILTRDEGYLLDPAAALTVSGST